MLLPNNHQWYNKAPTVSDKFLPYFVVGSSNHAVGGQLSTISAHYNANRNFIYKHNDTIVPFSDPPNDQSITTYDRLDTAGTQNYTSFLSERLRERTDRKPCAITGGQNTTGILHGTAGYNSPITLQQTTDLLTAAKAKTGAPIAFACVGVSDGDMKFNPTEAQIITAITSYITNLRTAAGQADLPILLICPGLIPTTPATAAIYPTWALHNSTLKAINISGVHIVDTDSLDVSTYREADEIHRNVMGNKACAGLIFDVSVSNNIL